MRRAITATLCVFCYGAANAQAVLGSSIADRVRAGLPADLALVELIIPGAIGDGATVVWARPPRAGTVTILLEDGPRRLWARARLAPVRPMLVALRPLRAGSRIAAGDVGREPRPDVGGAVRALPAALLGAEILCDVPAGAAVPGAALTLPAPLPGGSVLTIVAQRGAARVSTAGLLERPARPGEAAAARVGQRVVRGVLLDTHTMLVGAQP